MTINKKSARKIVVQNEPYRWTILPVSGYIVLVAEHEVVQGQRMEVYIQSEIDRMWVEFPHSDHLNLRIVKPKDVERIIGEAIKQGWTPKDKGKPVKFHLNGELLVRRNS